MAAADRLLVRQFVAEHVKLGGADPLFAPLANAPSESTHRQSKPSRPSRLGSNPFLQLHSIRMAALKQQHASQRALTPYDPVGSDANLLGE